MLCYYLLGCSEASGTEGFFDVDPHGKGFALFSDIHLAWLAIFLSVTVALCAIYRRVGPKGRRRMEIAIGVILGVGEAARLLVLYLAGELNIYFLPLHFCALSIFIEIWYVIRGGKVLGDILYAACMPGALMALLFPDWVDYPAFCFLSQNSFVIHTLLVAYPVMLVAGGKIKPDAKNIPRVFLFLLALAVPMYIFDRATGTNYMFLNWPSAGSPLEWFAPLGRPGFVIGYFPIMAVAWSVLYIPWVAIHKAKKKE